MSNADLEAKLYDQTKVIARDVANRVIDRCWQLDRLADVRDLIRLTVPPH
jgi:hypothetical protein